MMNKIPDPVIDNNQRIIAEKRYFKLDKDFKPSETVGQMFYRISKFIAKAETDMSDKNKGYRSPSKNRLEKIINDFFTIQYNFEFLSGMVLLDRGKQDLVAACYVMPIKDSLESIYGTLAQTVTLHRRGAGVGYDFSEIRPEGAVVTTTGKQASGPISFMKLYDFSSEVILNKGAVRHAAHMGILRIDHPDILKFVNAKRNNSQLTNFNLSVAVTDEFIKALENGQEYALKHEGKVYQKIPAKAVLDEIVESIFNSGEPGFIFIDEVNRHNYTLNIGKITSTNVCGEQPLLPYEACNLGSVVLSKFVYFDKLNENLSVEKKINWERMAKVIKLGVRFLDNTLTISHHLLPEIEKIVKFGNRKVGLGVMGWADLLYLLEIPYDSEQALNLAEKLMKFVNETAREASRVLGKERGNFGNFKNSFWDQKNEKFMRNATVTTIAPNGTVSLFADCNGGIEPFFALGYVRRNMETIDNKVLVYINKHLEEKLKREWLYTRELMREISEKGSLKDIDTVPERIRKVFVTAMDISPDWHIRMQASFQKYTDNAVSKTVNFPENATRDDIFKAFKLACKLKLKGLTIYRDKSRNAQVLNLNSHTAKK